MGRLNDVLMKLAPPADMELRDGYVRYEMQLASILTPEQMDAYVDRVEQTGMVRVYDALTADEMAALSPEEAAIATSVMAHEYISMENRRIAALLNQRGQHDVAPDLTTTATAQPSGPVVPEPPR